MAVAFDAQISAPIGGAGTSFTDSTSMTVGSGTNRALLVMLIWDTTVTAPSVTWNGVSLTLLVSKVASDSTSTVAIFGLRNPASGTNTLAGSWTASFGDFVVGAISFTGVDQSNDATAFQNAVSSVAASSPASITATSATGDMAAAVFGINNAFSGSGFTAVSSTTFFNLVNANDAVGAGAYTAGTASVTLTATYGIAADNAAAAVSVHASGGAAAEPRAPYVTKLPPFPKVPPPVQAYNQNLYGTVVIQTPFNQTDFSKAFDIRQVPLTDQTLNINVFSNAFPNNQYDFPKVFDLRQAPFFQHETLNINVFSNPFPNNQTDFPKAFDIRQAPFSPDQALNINVFSNAFPFNQTDFSKPFDMRQSPFSPTDPLNINLFTNPFPFDQYDWSKPIRIKQAPFSPTDPLNINLFTNPIPILNLDLDTQVRLRPVVDSSQPYNVNLYGIVVVTVPFNQVDFARPFVPRPAVMLDQTLNPNVFTNPFPFNQYDFLSPYRTPDFQPDPDQSVNINIFAVVPLPFIPIDWNKPFVPKFPPTIDQALNVNLFTNPYPFNQYDYLKPRKVPQAPYDLSFQLNPNLYNFFPFNQYDYLKPLRTRQAPIVVDQALNINTFTNPYPFNQYDFLKPKKVPQAPFSPDPSPLNINLFTNAFPFNQYDWSKPIKVPQAPIKVDQQANLGMLFNPFPFVQYDYAKPVRVPTAPFDKSVSLNLNLFKNAFPFNQYAWPAASRVKIGYAPQLYSAALYSPVVVTATLHPVKFIGNVGTMLRR